MPPKKSDSQIAQCLTWSPFVNFVNTAVSISHWHDIDNMTLILPERKYQVSSNFRTLLKSIFTWRALAKSYWQKEILCNTGLRWMKSVWYFQLIIWEFTQCGSVLYTLKPSFSEFRVQLHLHWTLNPLPMLSFALHCANFNPRLKWTSACSAKS